MLPKFSKPDEPKDFRSVEILPMSLPAKLFHQYQTGSNGEGYCRERYPAAKTPRKKNSREFLLNNN
jgi:hypothetical protein